MRIGILTFHRAINYGALIQAYALKTTIENLGHQVSIIDYRNPMLEKMYEYKGFFMQNGAKNKLRWMLYSKIENNKRKNYDLFRQNYLGIKGPGISKEDLSKLNDEYNHFFVGSDQVWSPDAHGHDSTFFLDFVQDHSKVHSYAASFGVAKLKEEDIMFYQAQLAKFSSCSVREEAGKAIISSILEKDIRIDVDPVMLLSKEDWIQHLGLKASGEKYAFVYTFSMTEATKKMIEKCHKAGLKIYIVGQNARNPFDFPCTYVGDMGPFEFMQMLYGASFVITNSFHGAALSIVLNKPFSLAYLTGESQKANSRLEQLIQMTGLEDRVINDDSNFEEVLLRMPDWDSANTIVKNKKADSMSYIERCLYE